LVRFISKTTTAASSEYAEVTVAYMTDAGLESSKYRTESEAGITDEERESGQEVEDETESDKPAKQRRKESLARKWSTRPSQKPTKQRKKECLGQIPK
jgi:hypothetical protein